jgi:hypothetical protein
MNNQKRSRRIGRGRAATARASAARPALASESAYGSTNMAAAEKRPGRTRTKPIEPDGPRQ